MSPDREPRVPVGVIRRAHGIKGAVLVSPLTDVPDRRYVVGARFSTAGDPARDLAVSAVRPHQEGLLVEFESIPDRTAAEELRGELLTIPASERRRLDEDEFWEDDLVGLRVARADGSAVGTLTAVIRGPAQDRLVVATGSGDTVEVPFVDAIVKEVLVAEGRIVIDPPEGLF